MRSGFRTPLLKPLCAVAMGLLLSTAAAIAQNDWQAAYDPGASKNASARGGIAYTLNNTGTVTAGEMEIYNTTTDIYIIKHDDCGNPIWQKSYEIGNIDSCRKIRAIPNDPDKGFIVVGTTQHYFPPLPAPQPVCIPSGNYPNQIFLMKIDSLGEVKWAQTYGGTDEEQGWDVQVVSGGFIVAGMTRSYGRGGSDALLMKVDLNGNFMWARTYGGPLDDYFLSCAIASPLPGQISGDILAVGGTKNYGAGNTDVFLARVEQSSGSVLPAPSLNFLQSYGTTSTEAGWRVLECSNPTKEIAVCGYTTHYSGVPGADGLILITDATGGSYRAHYYSGTLSNNWDEFMDMMELGNASLDLMVTGTAFQPVGGFGGYDVYVGRVDRNTLVPVNTLLFGGPFQDEGWGITRNPASAGTGFQVAGLTYRIHPTTPSDLDVYVISRPDITTLGCKVSLNPVHGPATLATRTTFAEWEDYPATLPHCTPDVTAIPQFAFDPICGECYGTRTMRDETPSIGEWEVEGAGEEANAGDAADLSVSSVGRSGEASAALYPNPVKRGNSFTLALPNGPGGVEITVTDMSGKMIHTRTAGGSEVAIDTDGWSSGVYAIRLSREGKTATRQIVVTE